MGTHSQKDVEDLIERLQVRHEKLVEVMRGRETERLTGSGMQTGIAISARDIRFAVDDVVTALKEVRGRLGKE
ncbi:hypothetical protein CW310_31345 [Pseudomonas citronellolis]|uniref:hypothetical protein n=1 Tax=Pseudomonas citronellolis TaxID=53408 RepID=UPI0009440239|nr:hypothetical protein [Pseudomonas citronellolis]TGC21013.1 hypothetical protein CW310_31345 [Pseudomonas citronellolis]